MTQLGSFTQSEKSRIVFGFQNGKSLRLKTLKALLGAKAHTKVLNQSTRLELQFL